MPLKQRILLCRLGFVLLCVFPTLAVASWIATRPAGSVAGITRDGWEVELSRRLELRVEIEEVTYPEPTTARLEGVTLRDPETHDLVAQASALELQHSPTDWQVQTSQLCIETSQLPLLRQTLEQRVFRQPVVSLESKQTLITLLPSDVTLHGESGSHTLVQSEGHIHSTVGGVEVILAWKMPDAASDNPCVLKIARDRSATPPQTAWHFDTAGQPVACALIADLLPMAARLGSECRFAGHIEWTEKPTETSGNLVGTFSDLDLDALVTEQFPHQLSGRGQLVINQATVTDGTLTELSGTLHAEHGSISPSLVSALAEHLQLDAPQGLHEPATSRPIPFGQLGVQFHIDGRALRLSSVAGVNEPGVLIASAVGPILAAPPQHTTSPVNLLRALLPDNQYQVPATRQTSALVGLFPVPDLAPVRTAALLKHTPTRLRSSGPPDAAPVLRQPTLR
jgi:hypothetical protein